MLQESKTKKGPRNTILLLVKAESKWWPRLLKAAGKAPPYVKVDWDKWVDEDEENGSGRKYCSTEEGLPFIDGKGLLAGALAKAGCLNTTLQAVEDRWPASLLAARSCETTACPAPSMLTGSPSACSLCLVCCVLSGS